MDQAEYTLLIVNGIFGLGCAYPLARRLANIRMIPSRTLHLYLLLIFVYLFECVAFAAGMATNIPGLVLAILWGILLGYWLRRFVYSIKVVFITSLLFSIYSSLPAVSFSVVPIVLTISGWSILTAEGGVQFGIPEFLPWPINTIIGFCIVVSILALVLKTIITTGEVVLLFRLRRESKPNPRIVE